MSRSRLSRLCLGVAAAGVACVGPLEAQDVPRFQLEGRAGFLITFASGHSDRPLAAVETGYRILVPRVGGPPGLTVTAGAGVGFAEFFAEVQSESFRVAAGVEVPWAVAARGLGRAPIELVPNVELGRLSSNGGDEREGLYGRGAIGLRAPIGSGGLYLTFEPVALVWLPSPEPPGGSELPVIVDPGSRFALELGIVSVGLRF